MLRFKPEVRIGVWSPELVQMFEVACDWSLVHGIDVRVNSVNDGPGVHQPNSLHYVDLAADFGPDSNVFRDRQSLADYFRVRLVGSYDVIFEADHVHVEYDAKRPGLKAPPTVPTGPATASGAAQR